MIAKSQITEDSLQAHGQRYIREKHIDDLGNEHLFSYPGSKGVNAEKVMSERIPHINAMLAKETIVELNLCPNCGIDLDGVK